MKKKKKKKNECKQTIMMNYDEIIKRHNDDKTFTLSSLEEAILCVVVMNRGNAPNSFGMCQNAESIHKMSIDFWHPGGLIHNVKVIKRQ